MIISPSDGEAPAPVFWAHHISAVKCKVTGDGTGKLVSRLDLRSRPTVRKRVSKTVCFTRAAFGARLFVLCPCFCQIFVIRR